MAKSRKTLRQKKLADHHAQQQPTETTSPSMFRYNQVDSTPPTVTQKSTIATPSLSYPTIKKDLFKTLALTSTIVVAELVLFFVL